MMISPEGYYEEYLKGKTEKQIVSVIRGLKKEIGHLKNIMEHPEYRCTKLPSEAVRLSCTREYLERAKEALKEAGGIYIPSKADQRAAAFDENVSEICKMEFEIGNAIKYEKYIVEISDELKAIRENFWEDKETCVLINEDGEPFEKQDFLNAIRNLHIGEWRTRYDTERFGYFVLDGIMWELIIEFSNSHKPLKILGSNSYPYNFADLVAIFKNDNDFNNA